MTPDDIIKDAAAYSAEYCEMSDNPAAIVAGVLASRIIKLTEQVEYLERRLYASNKQS
jgi:hypothetical protein